MNRKVLIITPTMSKGGAERVALNLSSSLAERGYSVSLVVLRLNSKAYDVAEGVNLVPLCKGKPDRSLLSRMFFAARTFIKFFSIIKKLRPRAVISFTTSTNTWTGIVCNLFGVPYIVSERTTPDRTIHPLNPVSKKIVYELYRRSHALVVPSEGILLNLKKNQSFARLKNTVIIRNAISKFNEPATARVHPRPFILAVGRLHTVKGFDRLIEAFKHLDMPDVDLLIVGKGKEKEGLSRQIKDLGLTDRVVLTGLKENIQDYYKQCEIYVLSSRNEGYPNALIEAMSMGCACIAFDCEFGPREIIEHGENGLLIPNNDIMLLRQSMNLLLNDPELKAKLSANAEKIAESNSTDVIMSKWEELIS